MGSQAVGFVVRRVVLGVALLGLVACGRPVEVYASPSPLPTLTAPPTVAESVGVQALMGGDPCGLVGADLRERLGVLADSEPYVDGGRKGCRWEESASGVWLGVLVKPMEDPLAKHYDRPGVEVTEVGGFPAIVQTVDSAPCQIWVKTAPTQGFWVVYGTSAGRLDACAGARAVAEHLAGRVRGD